MAARDEITMQVDEAQSRTITFRTIPKKGSFLIARGDDVWVNWSGTAAVKRTSWVDGTQNEGANESIKILDGESFPLEGIKEIHIIGDTGEAQIYCAIVSSLSEIPGGVMP